MSCLLPSFSVIACGGRKACLIGSCTVVQNLLKDCASQMLVPRQLPLVPIEASGMAGFSFVRKGGSYLSPKTGPAHLSPPTPTGIPIYFITFIANHFSRMKLGWLPGSHHLSC